MADVLSRKPLLLAEENEATCIVCVTGAAGYIASSIVCRLLASGHTVHATFRKEDHEPTLQSLKQLPGARDRLKWFEADLLVPGSFDEAISGCKYLIHSAANVTLDCPAEMAYTKLVLPAVRGVQNVLAAVNKAPNVERVIMTSSYGAVMGDFYVTGEGQCYTEDDWTLHVSSNDAYTMAKTFSEWQAWAINSQQKRWSLVTIAPGFVTGPPFTANPTAAKTFAALNGPRSVVPVGYAVVDISDVAAAHIMAMVNKKASGRYLLCERSLLNTEIAQWFKKTYPQLKTPYNPLPLWALQILSLLPGFGTLRNVKKVYNKKAVVSSAKAARDLELSFIPFEESMQSMVQRMAEFGMFSSEPIPNA